VLDALVWLLAIELLGLVALPLTFLLFHRLPDRGFTLSKPLALVLFSFILWVLGLAHVLPNSIFTIIAILALGTGVRGVRWTDIEVVRGRGQAPRIELHGTALARAERLGLSQLALSLSHSKDYAVASVVGESRHGNILAARN